MITPGSARPPEDAVGFDASDRAGTAGSPVEPTSVDPNTGVWSASAWDVVVGHEAARLARSHRPVSILAVAIDRVDELADALGPRVADNYVRAVATILRRLTSAPDFVARSDDGPFLLLLAEADEPARLDFARRVRVECDPWLEAAWPGTRLSIEGASLNAEQSFDVAVRAALDGVMARTIQAQPD